jgi:hypothetical protein
MILETKLRLEELEARNVLSSYSPEEFRIAFEKYVFLKQRDEAERMKAITITVAAPALPRVVPLPNPPSGPPKVNKPVVSAWASDVREGNAHGLDPWALFEDHLFRCCLGG